MDQLTWQDRVKLIIEGSGMRNQDLADKLGVSLRIVGDWKGGTRDEPKGYTAVRIYLMSERYRRKLKAA